ncbi:hypothetical protein AV530_001335 [Patagioenas fasciata monilis]|uniref:Uncharacterized protein n=1 Tax=Patagioenas fasciata monilis TaxID=372326 RepID=A0A1V4JQQ0_PATFA|nr:hypothetical protein AV530_001335 [Patagioenas fasciata monilis]
MEGEGSKAAKTVLMTLCQHKDPPAPTPRDSQGKMEPQELAPTCQTKPLEDTELAPAEAAELYLLHLPVGGFLSC